MENNSKQTNKIRNLNLEISLIFSNEYSIIELNNHRGSRLNTQKAKEMIERGRGRERDREKERRERVYT